jgi:hypothetical protein
MNNFLNITDQHDCTWAGSEKAQIQQWCTLSLREKLDANEQMVKTANYMIEQRRQKGLPYIDPKTGECAR